MSRPLCLLTSRLLRWAESFDVHLEARYLPGESNVPGRCTQPSRASCGDRVVSPPSGGESTSSYVGQSVDRPVRDLASTRSCPYTARLSRIHRPSSRMRFVILGTTWIFTRFPPLCSGRSGDRSRPAVIASRDDSGRTSLAREGVVRRLAASTDPTTPGSTLLGQAASAAPFATCSIKAPTR